MMVICKKCGGQHPTWDCKASEAKIAAYAATKSSGKGAHAVPSTARHRPAAVGLSTAARKDVPEWGGPAVGRPAERLGSGGSNPPPTSGRVIAPAGTRAPPVDTIKRGPGRPPGPVPFDKKAHDRKKSAERRAKLKEPKP